MPRLFGPTITLPVRQIQNQCVSIEISHPSFQVPGGVTLNASDITWNADGNPHPYPNLASGIYTAHFDANGYDEEDVFYTSGASEVPSNIEYSQKTTWKFDAQGNISVTVFQYDKNGSLTFGPFVYLIMKSP